MVNSSFVRALGIAVVAILCCGINFAAEKKVKIRGLPLVDGQGVIRGVAPKDTLSVDVTIDGTSGAERTTDLDGRDFEITLVSTLVAGQKVTIVADVGGTPVSAETKVVAKDDVHVDGRESFLASGYVGIAVDSFASGDTQKYLNPEASGEIQERGVGGFDFAYRLAGDREHARAGKGSKLWLYGETVHGVRSSDVDCEKNPTFPTCENALPMATGAETLFIIRNSTSLEAFMGLRWEFQTLQRWSNHPANLYLNTQVGFITVADGPDDVSDVHHVGLGAIAINGPFEGSYLEAGFGRSDLFAEKPKDRWKLDALLSRDIGNGTSFFVQLTMDADAGNGSDNIQTYLGVDFDLRKNPCKWFGFCK